MRWAIIGAYETDSLEFHLQDSLQFLGHETKVFDLSFGWPKGRTMHYWLRRFSSSFDEARGRRLAHEILEYKPDIVIGVYRYINPTTIEIIKQRSPSTIVIHINPDQLTTLEQQQIFASPYDFYFTKDPFMVRFMRNMAGLNAYYLPEAFNPRFHTPPDQLDRSEFEIQEDTDILLFGGMYPYRSRILEHIIKADLKIKVYGNQAKYLTPSVASVFQNQTILGKDKSHKIVGARIVLNCLHYAEVESVNVKYFEIWGVGGFQICDYKPTLHEYSPLDPGLNSYQSIGQAIEMIQHYLPLTSERHAVAARQREHFLLHHTYEHRVKKVIEIIS